MGAGGPGYMYGFTYLTGSEYTSVPPNTGTQPTTTTPVSTTSSTQPPPTTTAYLYGARIYACLSSEDTAAGPIDNLFWAEYDFFSGTPITQSGTAFCNEIQSRTQSMGGNNHFTDYPSAFTIPGTLQDTYSQCTYFDARAPSAAAGSIACAGFASAAPCPTVTASASMSCLDGSGENIVYFTPLADCVLP